MGKVYAHTSMLVQVKVFHETSSIQLEQAMNKFFAQLGSYNEFWDPTSQIKFKWELVDIRITSDKDAYNKIAVVVINANFRLSDIPAINAMLKELQSEGKEGDKDA